MDRQTDGADRITSRVNAVGKYEDGIGNQSYLAVAATATVCMFHTDRT